MTSWKKRTSLIAALNLFLLTCLIAAWQTIDSELGDQNEVDIGPVTIADIENETNSPPYYEAELKNVRSLNGSFIPVPWHFCDVSYPSDESVNVSCEIPANDYLSLKKYQSWIELVNRTNRLKVKCDSGGNISAPWPMKVSGLQSLEIEGCNVKDYIRHQAFGDYYSYTGPDVLKVLKIFNSVLYSDFLSLNQTFYRKSGSRDTECGSLELRELRMRDITIGFEQALKIPLQLHGNKATDNSTFKPIEQYEKPKLDGPFPQPQMWCSHNHMGILEFSNYAFFRVLIKMLIRGHGYPALHTFIADRNNITVFPYALFATIIYFPKLRYVDLRYNNITELKIPPGSKRIFDLRHNNIQDITTRNIESMMEPYVADVDFRNNPINCGCKNVEVVKYARTKTVLNKLKNSTFRYLFDMPCNHGTITTTFQSVSLDNFDDCFIIRHRSSVPWVVLGLLTCFGVLTTVFAVYFRREIHILLETRSKCGCCGPKSRSTERRNSNTSCNVEDESTSARELEIQKRNMYHTSTL